MTAKSGTGFLGGCLGLVLWSTAAMDASQNSPHPPQDQPLHMFVDDDGIACWDNIRRIVQTPARHANPLIASNERPWQPNPYLFGTVLYDEDQQIYKMWYFSFDFRGTLPLRTPVLYATSDDGLQWDFPALGLVEYDGSTANNILFAGIGIAALYTPSVIKDRADPDASRRYKMVYWDSTHANYYEDPDNRIGGGMFTATSPDGIHWSRTEQSVVPARRAEHGISDVLDLMRDPQTGNYVVYAKGWAVTDGRFATHRQIVRTESSDFINWSEPEVVIRHARDANDPQSYGMTAFYYEGLYLGFLRSYKQPGNDTIDIRLAVSRDNRTWSLVAEGQTFMPVGEEGRWDSGMLFTSPPVMRDDEIRIYYGGWDGRHNVRQRNAAIGLATLPRGRFVALATACGGTAPGTITTRPVRLSGRAIELNVDASRRADRVTVELLDDDFKPIDGFGFAQADTVRTDSLRHRLSWNGQDDLTRLRGRDVRLRLTLEGGAMIYGYRLLDPH